MVGFNLLPSYWDKSSILPPLISSSWLDIRLGLLAQSSEKASHFNGLLGFSYLHQGCYGSNLWLRSCLAGGVQIEQSINSPAGSVQVPFNIQLPAFIHSRSIDLRTHFGALTSFSYSFPASNLKIEGSGGPTFGLSLNLGRAQQFSIAATGIFLLSTDLYGGPNPIGKFSQNLLVDTTFSLRSRRVPFAVGVSFEQPLSSTLDKMYKITPHTLLALRIRDRFGLNVIGAADITDVSKTFSVAFGPAWLPQTAKPLPKAEAPYKTVKETKSKPVSPFNVRRKIETQFLETHDSPFQMVHLDNLTADEKKAFQFKEGDYLLVQLKNGQLFVFSAYQSKESYRGYLSSQSGEQVIIDIASTLYAREVKNYNEDKDTDPKQLKDTGVFGNRKNYTDSGLVAFRTDHELAKYFFDQEGDGCVAATLANGFVKVGFFRNNEGGIERAKQTFETLYRMMQGGRFQIRQLINKEEKAPFTEEEAVKMDSVKADVFAENGKGYLSGVRARWLSPEKLREQLQHPPSNSFIMVQLPHFDNHVALLFGYNEERNKIRFLDTFTGAIVETHFSPFDVSLLAKTGHAIDPTGTKGLFELSNDQLFLQVVIENLDEFLDAKKRFREHLKYDEREDRP